MKKHLRLLSLLICSALLVSACSSSKNMSEQKITEISTMKEGNDKMITKISAKEAKKLLEQGGQIIDVREENEYATGHIPGSTLMPLSSLKDTAKNINQDKNAPIVVYCQSGKRSAKAAIILQEKGYTNVKDLGSIKNWSYEIEKNVN